MPSRSPAKFARTQPEPPRAVSISAVTLATGDMARAVRFYDALGFPRSRGGPQDEFTSFAVGDGSLNLMTAADPPTGFWGRVIFHVTDVDAFYDRVRRAGLNPDFPPRDADWGERYFHLRDPDGHDLSFARLLKQQSE